MLRISLVVMLAAVLPTQHDVAAQPARSGAGVVDPCLSTAVPTGHALFCPAGDGSHAVITVTVRDQSGYPVPGVPADDIWVILCGTLECPCGDVPELNADDATDANGVATISGSFATGGTFSGLRVIVQGIEIGHPDDCSTPYCLDLFVRSPDINCDLEVSLIDLAFFAGVVGNGLFDDRCDFNGDGFVNAEDLTIFAPHYLHECAP